MVIKAKLISAETKRTKFLSENLTKIIELFNVAECYTKYLEANIDNLSVGLILIHLSHARVYSNYDIRDEDYNGYEYLVSTKYRPIKDKTLPEFEVKGMSLDSCEEATIKITSGARYYVYAIAEVDDLLKFYCE